MNDNRTEQPNELLSYLDKLENLIGEFRKVILQNNGNMQLKDTTPEMLLGLIDNRLKNDIHELNEQINYYYKSGICDMKTTIAQLVQELYIKKIFHKVQKDRFPKADLSRNKA